MESLNFLLDTLLIRLAWTSAQAVLLIGAVWLIGRLLPRLPAALRCTLWWLVGLQLILGLCWSSPLKGGQRLRRSRPLSTITPSCRPQPSRLAYRWLARWQKRPGRRQPRGTRTGGRSWFRCGWPPCSCNCS